VAGFPAGGAPFPRAYLLNSNGTGRLCPTLLACCSREGGAVRTSRLTPPNRSLFLSPASNRFRPLSPCRLHKPEICSRARTFVGFQAGAAEILSHPLVRDCAREGWGTIIKVHGTESDVMLRAKGCATSRFPPFSAFAFSCSRQRLGCDGAEPEGTSMPFQLLESISFQANRALGALRSPCREIFVPCFRQSVLLPATAGGSNSRKGRSRRSSELQHKPSSIERYARR
jgi:hypothetical protein